MKYKIKDNQLDRYFADRELFNNFEEIVNQLASYHDNDFSGVDNKDNELAIKEYFDYWKIITIEEKLKWLLEYGEWTIHDEDGNEVIIK